MDLKQIPTNDTPHGLLGQRQLSVVQQQSVSFVDVLLVAAAVCPHDLKDFWRLDLYDPLLAALSADQEPQFVLTQLNGLR